VIRELAGEAVRVVDPAEETVKELAALLALEKDEAGGDGARDCGEFRGDPAQGRIEHRFFVSGAAASFYSSGRQFLGDFPFQVEQASLRGSRFEIGNKL
jgi:glutamate racemase